MPQVTLIDETLASVPLPAPVDICKVSTPSTPPESHPRHQFMLTLLLALPLGFVSRLVPLGTARHLYNFFIGLCFAQMCYGPGWLHLFFSSTVTTSPRRSSNGL